LPCPWYQYGVCTSPKLPGPTDAVVSATRCLSDNEYKSCAYYVESSSLKLNNQKSLRRDKLKIYVPIHALPKEISIECPYAALSKMEMGIVIAYCKVLDRPLTRFEAITCSKYWRDCPFRQLVPM